MDGIILWQSQYLLLILMRCRKVPSTTKEARGIIKAITPKAHTIRYSKNFIFFDFYIVLYVFIIMKVNVELCQYSP